MPRGKVKRIIDGDTLELSGGERVRIVSVFKAAELSARGGQAAKRRLQDVAPPGTEIGLSKPVAYSYGRSVRGVTVERRPVVELVTRKDTSHRNGK